MSNTEINGETLNTPEAFVEQVKEELDKITSPRKNLLQKLWTLLLSLIIFVSLGLFQKSFTSVVVIVVVLLIHEIGHFIGMYAFRYRNLHMSFVPFFGGVVSGVESEPSSARKAVVSLAGPVPGIILGVICAILFFLTKNDLFAVSASPFLFINGFNLLPFHPLDGGRCLDDLLFSRRPRLEIAFKVLTALVLCGLSIVLRDFFLGLFALFALFSLKGTLLSANIANQIRTDTGPHERRRISMREANLIGTLGRLRDKLAAQKDNPKVTARYVHAVWQRVRNEQASTSAITCLVAVYLFFMGVGIGAPLAFEVGKAVTEVKTELIKRSNEDGSYTSVQVWRFRGQKLTEIVVNGEGLYDGAQTQWWANGNKRAEGTWKAGYWNGIWKNWNEQGQLVSVTEYQMGKPIRFAIMKRGSLVDLTEDEWPPYFKKGAQTRPKGPKTASTRRP